MGLKENDPVAYEKELSKLGAAGGAAAGITGAAAVAGVDKATKDKLQKMKESDPAAYEAELKKIGEKAVASLDKATQERLAKLKASDPAAYEKELKKLGSVAAAGGQPAGGRVGQQVASNGLNGSVGAGGVTAEQEELVAKMLASGMDEATAYQYLQQLCGVAGKGMTPEAKALMEQILASNGSKEEIASRVEALLAGSELSSSRGINGGIDGTNLSEARSGTLNEDNLARPGQQGSLADRIRARNAAKQEQQLARGSVKRQSEIQREKKKSRQEEREEEKARKASYYRKVTGLRRAKVPMMVYSCGGFSRCFRVCRFYDVEGPPVGVEYEAPTPLTNTRNL